MSQRPVNLTHSNNLLPFIEYFESQGIQWRDTADQYQIPDMLEDQIYWLPTHAALSFISAMISKSHDRLGIEVGQLLTVGHMFPELGQALDKCQSLSDGIHALVEQMQTMNNHVIFWPEKINDKWYLCHRGAYPIFAPAYDQAEWFRSFALITMCRDFLGETWIPHSVWLSFKSHLAQRLPTGMESVEVTYEQAYGAIEVPLPQDFKPVEIDYKREAWFDEIKRLVHSYAPLPWFNIDWLAGFIGVSTRTMKRRFTENQCSFQELKETKRCELACELLEQLVPVADVAWRCGYSDLSNFNRAFRRWKSMTPAQYRKAHGSKQT
ncbi:helix-turn-helix domain-containing protein [Vibrio agarivorans]|uniref:helix-turn-helix domain-containing protein n=1 Tax=Vibrio agarivorans TaxID=153622 RepID=UPI00223099D0|nr:AraC family transcriptional regulator [Vibrio agarivorans]MDN3660583.1 AraC family transcriptional regulator [Vibrio agarivorans]